MSPAASDIPPADKVAINKAYRTIPVNYSTGHKATHLSWIPALHTHHHTQLLIVHLISHWYLKLKGEKLQIQRHVLCSQWIHKATLFWKWGKWGSESHITFPWSITLISDRLLTTSVSCWRSHSQKSSHTFPFLDSVLDCLGDPGGIVRIRFLNSALWASPLCLPEKE